LRLLVEFNRLLTKYNVLLISNKNNLGRKVGNLSVPGYEGVKAPIYRYTLTDIFMKISF
jgi:hypothetical protein